MTIGPLILSSIASLKIYLSAAFSKRQLTGRRPALAAIGMLLVLVAGQPPGAAAEPVAPAAPPKPIQVKDIVFNTGQNYGETVKKYPSTVYRRGEVFDISLAIEGEPIFLQLDIHGPAGYTTLFDRLVCTANADGFADCNQGTKSQNGYIEWLSWTRFRVVLRNPETKDVLIGNYKVIVHIVGTDDSSHAVDSLIDFKKKFAVIFNPYDPKDEVYRPDDDVRQAFVYSKATGAAARDESGVWYTPREFQDPNDGIWRTEGKQRLFVLRPFSPQIFDKMIALLDAKKVSTAKEATEILSTFVDNHLHDDPNAVQHDVAELTTPGTAAQCASQANFLIAHLRSAGIPSLPIYIDANKWDQANWNFHTWVEAYMNNRWMAVDPFRGINTPTTRKALGVIGPAYDEKHNDLIGVGDVDWSIHKVNTRVYRAIFDGPNPMMKGHPEAFFATVDNTFLESSILYWPGGANPKTKGPIGFGKALTTAAQTGSMVVEVETDQAAYEVGETIGISVTLKNTTNSVMTVPLTVNLEGDYLLSKAPVDKTMVVYDQIEIVPPQGRLVIPLTAVIPADARTDYGYQVTADTGAQTASTSIDVSAFLELTLVLPNCFRSDQPFPVKAIFSNSSATTINNVSSNLTMSEGFLLLEQFPLSISTLEPGKSIATTFTVRPSDAGIGQFFLKASSDNGGAIETPAILTSLCPIFLPVIIGN